MMRVHSCVHKAALLLGSALCLLSPVVAQETSRRQPDNTGVNRRDRAKNEPTADDQKMNASDRELAKQIRRAVVDDKSLSTYAHNVKIIAQNGQVTLKGPVRSEEEKKAIEAKAVGVAGVSKVTNELSIAPDSDSSEHGKRKKK
ncbi:MAG TPA: BON domain-containing protein [Bryobacteraceae bacterium]|nr:BON domain-containing protein [Bryobacteraceae bacterium]